MSPSLSAACLWYVAPGLLHQLGNALFAVQGRARLLSPDGGAAQLAGERSAILDGTARAQSALSLLRWLCDDGRPEPTALRQVLAVLADALRVPLRDRGLELAVQPGDEVPVAPVDPGPVCVLLIAACRALSHTAAASPAGVLHLCATGGAGDLRVELALDQAPGALPFPLDRGHLQEQLASELAAAGCALDDNAPRQMLRFSVPTAKVTFRPA